MNVFEKERGRFGGGREKLSSESFSLPPPILRFPQKFQNTFPSGLREQGEPRGKAGGGEIGQRDAPVMEQERAVRAGMFRAVQLVPEERMPGGGEMPSGGMGGGRMGG